MSIRYSRPVLLCGVLLAVSLGSVRTVEARKKRVVVLPFSGPGGTRARSGVIKGLKKKAIILPLKKYTRTAKRLGVSAGSSSGMVATCSKVKCDAVIKGKVKRKRRRYSVTVSVFSGGTGKLIGRRAGRARGARRTARVGVSLGRKSLALVRKGGFKRGGAKPAGRSWEEEEDSYAPEPKEPAVAAAEPSTEPEPASEPEEADTSDIPVFKPEKRRAGQASDAEEEESSEDDEDADISRRGSAGAYAGLFDLSVGLGVASRSTELVGQDPSTAPNKYEGGMYWELTVRGDIYPMVPFVRGFARNFGLGVGYCRHLSISTKPKDSDESVSTTSTELLLDLRYRWVFSQRPTSPLVSIFAGYGMRDFDLGENDTLRSFNYRFFRVGVEGAVPITTPLVAITAGFDARPLLAAGPETVDSYGDRSGGFAWSVRGGLSGKLDFGVFYFFNFEYLSLSTEFSGLDPSMVRDDPAQPDYEPRDRADPSSGSDRFIRLWVGGGYAM